jgi:hypothetical protein
MHMKTANTVFNISLPSLEACTIPLTRVWDAKNAPSCGTLISVMQSAQYRLCGDFAVSLSRSKLKHRRSAGARVDQVIDADANN